MNPHPRDENFDVILEKVDSIKSFCSCLLSELESKHYRKNLIVSLQIYSKLTGGKHPYSHLRKRG